MYLIPQILFLAIDEMIKEFKLSFLDVGAICVFQMLDAGCFVFF